MRTQIHTIQRNFNHRVGLFAALAVMGLALSGCGSDEGVAGNEPIDSLIGGGSDTSLGTDDAMTVGDTECGEFSVCDVHVPGDTYENDGWNPGDAWNPWDSFTPDAGPVLCVSDNNCPSSPCSKGVCDPNSHQCVAYLAPDYSFCPGIGGACGVDGYCQAGKCMAKGMTCDDGNPCTQDACDPASGCIYQPIPGCGGGCKSDSQCNDGDPCTGDYCKGGSCISVAIPNCGSTGCQNDAQCNDGILCSIDKCQFSASGVGKCVHFAAAMDSVQCCDPLVNLAACNDGNPCTTDYCGGNYQCNYALIPGCGIPGCTNDMQCDDGIKCSIDKCQFGADGLGQCSHTGDLSQKGFCCDPNMNMITCYDGNPCTADQCGMDFQCSYPQVPGCGNGCKTGQDCNDGNACTTDMCYGGQCAYGGIACASSDPCTTVACDPKSGMCIATPIPGCGGNGCKADFQCDDGNFCTVDACLIDATGTGKCIHKVDPTQIGLCCDPASSSIPPCNDGDACTQDICGPDYMCQFIPTPGCVNKCKADSDCAAGDVCTIAKCDVASGVCLYGTIPNCCNPAYCDDGNPCTKDGCDAATGGCNWTPIPGCTKPCDPVSCNDYNPCTSDGCDSVGNCVYKVIPNCTAQFCKSDVECQDADKCTQDLCDTASYTCQHYQIPGCGMLMCMTNADCNDFDNCTGDLCLNGSCAHKAVTCDDGNPCTADQCLAMTGGCSNAPIPGCTATPCKSDAMCDDKNFCSLDTCVTGWCNHLFVPGCFPPP